MNALKRIEVDATETKPTAKDTKPKVIIPGDAVNRYVKACDALKAADAAKKENQISVFRAGVEKLIKVNIANPAAPASTVEVIDSTGATAQVQFKDAYGAVDADTVCTVFGQIRGVGGAILDVNEFVHEKLIAAFDSSVFMVADEFSQERFDAFKEAIDKVAAKFNVTSPLTCSKKVTAKPDFHSRRWSAIPDANAQLMLQRVMPATVAGRKVCEGKEEPAEKPVVESQPEIAPVPMPKLRRAKI